MAAEMDMTGESGENDALLGADRSGSADHSTADNEAADGARRRKGVPQGRKVAEAILELMAESEHITKVPGIRPGTKEGSAEWVRVEKYHEERYLNKQKAFIQNKVEAVFWLVAGYATLIGTNFIEVIMTDERVNRSFLNTGLISIVIILIMMLYLIFWLSLVHNVDWERIYNAPDHDVVSQRSPHRENIRTAIGTSALCFVLNILCFPIACWPVWHFWTIPILWVFSMACLNMLHFVPSFG